MSLGLILVKPFAASSSDKRRVVLGKTPMTYTGGENLKELNDIFKDAGGSPSGSMNGGGRKSTADNGILLSCTLLPAGCCKYSTSSRLELAKHVAKAHDVKGGVLAVSLVIAHHCTAEPVI
jgi:hypothetical protein